MQAYESALTALGHPSRVRILEALRVRPRMVTELAEALPISQPAVSQHLRVLQRARLVQAEPDGSRRIYRLNPSGLEEVRSFISRMWDDALDAYEKQAVVERAERKGD